MHMVICSFRRVEEVREGREGHLIVHFNRRSSGWSFVLFEVRRSSKGGGDKGREGGREGV